VTTVPFREQPLTERPPRPRAASGVRDGQNRLVGRGVLVVGAGQADEGLELSPMPLGNGRAIAVLAAREGARVACADLEEDRAAATVRAIAEEGGEATAIAGDATDETDMERIVASACDWLGGLDGLVLNVGLARGGTLEETSLADLRAVHTTNVVSAFLGVKHALPRMLPGGAMVIISAIAAFKIGPTPLPYDLSKAALERLVRHAARSGEPLGIRANAIAPGAIATPMAIRAFGGDHRLPWGREGTAWETAHAVSFLLSDESSYVNATTLVVDGGLSALH
jgi:NAD(P)-dependent dehydrogenase (short-subunit alcohol dehydrogenase family)